MSNFNGMKRTWKVQSTETYELKDHLIKIAGDEGEGQATVACESDSRHKYENGTFHANPARIVSESYMITLQLGGHQIIYKPTGTTGGSWTADDNYPEDEN